MKSEPLPYMEFNVSKITIHKNYKAASLKNSMAVLRLEKAVPLGRYPTIATACLPGNLINIHADTKSRYLNSYFR